MNQFTPFRNPVFGFKAKRAGIITGYVNNYFVGLFRGTATLPVSIGSCGWGPVSYSWSADSCSSGIIGQNFDYSGYWNSMLFSITGDGFGGLIDLLDVNYVFLRVQ